MRLDRTEISIAFLLLTPFIFNSERVTVSPTKLNVVVTFAVAKMILPDLTCTQKKLIHCSLGESPLT